MANLKALPRESEQRLNERLIDSAGGATSDLSMNLPLQCTSRPFDAACHTGNAASGLLYPPIHLSGAANQTETAVHASRCPMRTLTEREIRDVSDETGWYAVMLALLAISAVFAIALFT